MFRIYQIVYSTNLTNGVKFITLTDYSQNSAIAKLKALYGQMEIIKIKEKNNVNIKHNKSHR